MNLREVRRGRTRMIPALKPEGKGLRVLEMIYVPLSKIKEHIKKEKDETGTIVVTNRVRAKSIILNFVNDFIEVIKNGKYMKDYNVPPVVVKDKNGFRLIAGEHRYVAHVRQNGDGTPEGTGMMWVAVCEFFEVEGKPAKHWESMYQSNENDPSARGVVGNGRTDDDIVCLVVNMIGDELTDTNTGKLIIVAEEKSVGDVLKGMNIKNKEQRINLTNKILKKTGSGIRVPQGYTTADVKTEFLTARNILPDIVTVMKRESSKKLDTTYLWRMFRNIVEELRKREKGKKSGPIELVVHFTGLTGSQIPKARTDFLKEFRNFFVFCGQFADAYKSGQMENNLHLSWKGQFLDEEILEDPKGKINYDKGAYDEDKN